MPRYLLVPEDADLSKIIRVCLPKAMVHRPIKLPQTKTDDTILDDSPKKSSALPESQVKNSLIKSTVLPISKGKDLKLLTKGVLDLVADKENGTRLLKFLKKNGIRMNGIGNLCYRDKTIPGGCYEELFIDAVDGTRRKPSLEFYRILRELNVDTSMIVRKRRKYLKLQ